MEEKKGCTVVNHYYGCCGKGTKNENGSDNGNGNGSDSTPVGTVISYMGMKAPKHYLACDGAIYNIAEYKEFSDFIKEEYGVFDFFGGDGVTTFAVPDLRNEFLRGYHGDKEEKLSGDIGAHQDATEHLNFQMSPDTVLFMTGGYHASLAARQTDKILVSDNNQGWTNPTRGSGWEGSGTTRYLSRPTNTAVLYCIKYE